MHKVSLLSSKYPLINKNNIPPKKKINVKEMRKMALFHPDQEVRIRALQAWKNYCDSNKNPLNYWLHKHHC